MGCAGSQLEAPALGDIGDSPAAAEKAYAEIRVSSLAVCPSGLYAAEDHGLVSYAITTSPTGGPSGEAECARAKGTAMIRKLASEKGANAVLGFSSSITSFPIAHGLQGHNTPQARLVMLFQGTAVTLQNYD